MRKYLHKLLIKLNLPISVVKPTKYFSNIWYSRFDPGIYWYNFESH